MTTLPSTFRPFTNLDWEAYAGCEDKNPLICEMDDRTIIVDGSWVVVHLTKPDEDALGDEYGREFPSPELARDIAEMLVHVKNPATFELILGEAL